VKEVEIEAHHGDHAEREQRGRHEVLPFDRAAQEAQRLELLHVQGRDHVALAQNHLALLDRHFDRRHRLHGLLSQALRRRGVRHVVRREVALDQGGGDLSLLRVWQGEG
jgi:hypothetical protein